jgi:hypothetical protein
MLQLSIEQIDKLIEIVGAAERSANPAVITTFEKLKMLVNLDQTTNNPNLLQSMMDELYKLRKEVDLLKSATKQHTTDGNLIPRIH